MVDHSLSFLQMEMGIIPFLIPGVNLISRGQYQIERSFGLAGGRIMLCY